jgi:hypothetical protein
MATAPRPGKVTARDEDEKSITVKIDGTPYTVYPNLVPARDAIAIRLQVGMPLAAVLDKMGDESQADVDLIAALVWVARCQAGERIDFLTVADEIGYETELAFDNPDTEEGETPIPEDHPLPEAGTA